MSPDEKNEKQELYCFMNQGRLCSAECMAFETFAPEGEDYKNKPWANCMVLVNTHRIGKHLVVLASGAGKLFNLLSTESADRKRTNQPPPAPPR